MMNEKSINSNNRLGNNGKKTLPNQGNSRLMHSSVNPNPIPNQLNGRPNKSLPNMNNNSRPKKTLNGTNPSVRPNTPIQNQNMNNNTIQEDSFDFVNILENMVGSFSILNKNVIAENLKLASGDGMSISDRTVPFECVDYIFSNLSYIFMGLILDENFKNAFEEVLMVELRIDSQPADIIEKIRKSMKDGREYQSKGSIVIGLTSFAPAIEQSLFTKMWDSFDKLDAFADEFDDAVNKLTDNQKIQYGFIFSNFMYLIRAFTHNDMFFAYVVKVIDNVKSIISQQSK